MPATTRQLARPIQATGEHRKPAIPEFWLATGAVVVFCSIFAFLVIQHARLTSATYDETTHLPAGYTYWQWRDYRMNPEHPPLVKKLAALPLLAKKPWPSQVELETEDRATSLDYTNTTAAIRRAWVSGLADINSQWEFGHYFLYGPKDETVQLLHSADAEIRHPLHIPTTLQLNEMDFFNDADNLVFWGRMPIMLLGILLAVLVFVWARELWGLPGGVLAIALFCFDPNFIAHSGLVTTDVGVTVFMFGAVYFLWRTCRRIDVTSSLLMLLFVALAFATKFSAILLTPIFVLAALGRIFSSTEWPVGTQGQYNLATASAKTLALLGLMAAAMLAAFVMIWASYDFRYSAAKDPAKSAKAENDSQLTESYQGRQPGHFPIEDIVRITASTQVMLKHWRADDAAPRITPSIKEEMDNAPIGVSGRLILFGQRHRILPEAYLYGFAHLQLTYLLHDSFLRGEYSARGFWNYFLWTFALKTPLATVLAVFAGLGYAIRRRDSWRLRLAFLLVPVIVYWIVSLGTNLNIGHRHLLPIYPFLFVLSGGLALEWGKFRPRTKPLVVCLALSAVVISNFVVFAPLRKPTVVYPHYLAYFNELAGGPPHGHKSLVDSNLDWGQDLKGLKHWLDNHQITEPIYLCYFGKADPRYYRISHHNVPHALGGHPMEAALNPHQFLKNLHTVNYLAISATNLEGVYLSRNARRIWQQILDQSTFVDTIGYSIFIYRIGR